ncbi:MAG: HAD family hydrolase [Clostridium sp.]
MEKKIIFFDADGTVVSLNGISELTKKAFKKLKENGHILVLSTGRSYAAIDGALKELGIEHMVCSAGGTVVINNEIVYKNPMRKESQKEIVEYFDKHGIIYNLEANDYIYTNLGHKEKYMKLFELPEKGSISEDDYEGLVNRRNFIHKRTKETENPLEIEVNKFHYYGADILYKENKCPLTYEQIVEDLGDKYTCVALSLSKFFSGGEICEKGVSKKVGMEVVLKYFNIKSENVYAIGDDYNDMEMIDFATTGIAMGHAPEEIKKVANYITRDIDNEGFYYAMEHFNLI